VCKAHRLSLAFPRHREQVSARFPHVIHNSTAENHPHPLQQVEEYHLPVMAKEEKAPWLDVPLREITSIEHPCIICNVDNGIKSLGGNQMIGQVCVLPPLSSRP